MNAQNPESRPFAAGLGVGAKIPAFRLADQNGKQVDFDAVKGPKGVAMLFFRSSDW